MNNNTTKQAAARQAGHQEEGIMDGISMRS
jgi:hypothetical protein